MEKISGIIPANSRVTTVDLKSSGSARAGTPSFGREIGASNLVRNADNREIAAQANIRHKELMSMRDTVTDPHADIVKKMSDGFFMKKNTDTPLPTVNYGPGADLVVDPSLKTNVIDMDARNRGIASAQDVETDVVNPEVQDLSFSAQGKEPSDDEPYMGKTLDVRA